MKKILLLPLLFCMKLGFAQEDALVFFTDKENVAASLANPITILSQAALDRKYAQGTPIDERDVPLNENYKATVAGTPGVTVLAKSKWLNAVYVRGSESAINGLQNLSFVSDIEFMDSNLNRSFPQKTPRDKFEMENQHRVVYNYGAAANQTEMIGADYLHEQDYNGEGVTVAFMDNGYPGVLTNPAYAHVRSEGRLLGYYDFVFREATLNGTGSHGASTFSDAAAIIENPIPEFAFVGTAPKASYYLFITEDSESETPVEEAYWVEALERADSLGVYVTNTSLGYQAYDNPTYSHQYPDLDGQTTIAARGANHGFDKGMINVTSAGNEGDGFGFVGTPGDAPGAFTVGAVDSEGDYVYFSSYGPTYDGRVKPDVMAQGFKAAIVNRFGAVSSANGTSFSSPIMAGAVASLWQAAPHLKNEVVMQVIRESASLYDNPTNLMGYGIPDFAEALNALLLLDTEEQMRETLFALYPNPVIDEINISFPQDQLNATFVLYDVLGRKIMEKQITPTRNRVKVADLPSGMYIASISANNKTTSFKIIKE